MPVWVYELESRERERRKTSILEIISNFDLLLQVFDRDSQGETLQKQRRAAAASLKVKRAARSSGDNFKAMKRSSFTFLQPLSSPEDLFRLEPKAGQ